MKSKIPLAALLLFAVSVTGCGGKLKIKDESVRLSLGGEHLLAVSAPKKAELSFSSGNPLIASVDETGTVKGLANGITVITVKNGTDYANVGVVVGTGVSSYVDEGGNIVSSLTASEADDALISGESDITALKVEIVGGGSEDVTIAGGRTYYLKITKTPADSSDKLIIKTEDASVARVEGSKLTGVARGKTKLTVTAPNSVSTEMIVRVK